CLMKPTAGRVYICGKDVTNAGENELPAARLRHIGFIFQSFNLFPALTAFSNVTLALKLKGYGWMQRRKEAGRLLERVGLDKCMRRNARALAGGQRPRLCLARALAGGSDVLLAAAPPAALDTAPGLSIMQLLKDETRSGGRAVFVVPHDPRLEKF